MKEDNKLSIIIPVYNESLTIELVLEKIKSAQLIGGFTKEILLINDASKDNSKHQIHTFIKNNKALNIKYLENKNNIGKGASIHKGIAAATGNFIIIQDADLEYDPNDYNKLLHLILKTQADVVYGSRFTKAHKAYRKFSVHYIANKTLTLLSNLFTGLRLTDMETCYKLFKANIIKGISLYEKRFGFEPEVTAKIARIKHIKIKEVQISYNRRSYSEGKKITWRDGVRAVYCIIKYGFLKR